MKRQLIFALVTLGALSVADVALGQQPPAKPSHGKAQPAGTGSVNIGEITIVGRVQKPIAAVEVGKIAAKLTLAELRQPFLDRIEEAIIHEPF